MHRTIKISALAMLSLATGNSFAQATDCNLYPYADGVVYDNNGHDLRGFAKSNKKETETRGAKIDEYSGGTWGYMQVGNARVPSVRVIPGKDRRVVLNHSEYIDATVDLFYTRDGIKGTWWARQCNNPLGPMFYKKVDDQGNLDLPNVRYGDLSHEMELKKFTLVEYNDSIYNQRDYDQLLKNNLLVENGVVKNVEDYKDIIAYLNNFLGKFTYTDDPLVANKSFITFLSVNNTRYVAWFNIVNGKLSGHLELAGFQYEQDKDPFVAGLVKKLKGKTIYIYGDDIFGLEKTFLKYKHDHRDLSFVRRKTDSNEKFNTDTKKS